MDNYNKGITLIALIIVIIIMLILVGVTVNVALNGELFIKTKQASNRTNDEVLRERIISYVIGAISEDGMFEFEKFRNNICKLDGEKEYFGDNTVIGKKYEVDINGRITPVTLIEMTKEESKKIYLETNSSGKITNCDMIGRKLEIPYKVEDELITVIGYRSMSQDGTIIWGDPTYLDIIISYGIKTIEDKAFYKNTYIKSIEIPKSVNKIGVEAFAGCSNLEKIVIKKEIGSLDLTNSGLTEEQINSIIWEP